MARSRWKACVAAMGLCVTMISAAGPAEAAGPALTDTGCEGYSDSVVRLYEGAFLRPPDQGGFDFWMVSYTSGTMSLAEIAEFFSMSPELEALYGDLTDAEYVDRIYRNVLERGPDDVGLAFWLDQMAAGMSRGRLLLRFTESPELVASTGTAEPTDGYFGNGLSEAWNCDVDHSDVSSVAEEFAKAIATDNTTRLSILSARVAEADPTLPEVELGSPALFLDPVDRDWPMCEPVGDFSQRCYWFLVEAGSITWTLEMIIGAEGIDFDGSGWTGRYVVNAYQVTRAG